jgi:Ca2+-binding EF-hand superfamily protein
MSEDDLKAVLAKYQQKSFELYNSNIVLETQVEQLNKTVVTLQEQLQKLSTKPKRTSKEEDFS